MSAAVLGWTLALGALHLGLGVPLARWVRSRNGRLSAIGTALVFLVGGMGLGAGVLTWLELTPERIPTAAWATVSLVTAGAGLFQARIFRTMTPLESGIALWLTFEVALLWLLGFGGRFDLASTPARVLLIAPALGALWGYFGLSVGYLLWGGRQRESLLGYEGSVGRRFLLSKSSSAISTVTTISTLGVALGVWLVIISLGILGGFERDLRTKIVGANAHVQIKAKGGGSFPADAVSAEGVRGISQVLSVAPFIEGEVAFAGSANYAAGTLVGLDPTRSAEVLDVFSTAIEGDFKELLLAPPPAAVAPERGEFPAPAPIPGIVLGVEMARSLSAVLGDRVNVISPALEVLTPFGPAPRILGFRVVGIFETKMYEYDARLAYVSLESARRFFQEAPEHISGLHVKLHDPEWVTHAAPALKATIGPEFTTLDWMERNQTLFSALKLERVVAFVVLAFIILVASFSIVNTLSMSIIEKQKEIAILLTMGARSIGIMKIFLVQGMLIGGFGAVLGGAAGSATAFALKRFGLWIPDDVYYIDSLPVHLEAGDVVVVVLAALLIVWDFAVFPAFRGSQLQPVEGLREG